MLYALFVAHTIQHDFVADRKHRIGVKSRRQIVDNFFCGIVAVFQNVEFHKFVRVKRDGNLFDNGFGNAVFADLENGFEFLLQSFKFCSVFR